MKKKILLAMLTLSMTASLFGCGKTEETVTEEVVIEETVEEAEEVEETEEVVEEVLEEAVEEVVETSELTDEEKAKYQIADFEVEAIVTNFKNGDLIACGTKIMTNLNNFIDYDMMKLLESRGYDTSNFVVTWVPAINQDGNVEVNGEKFEFVKFDDSEEPYIPLYPFFIKTSGYDDERLVYAANSNFEDIDNCFFGEDESGDAWLKILENYLVMKEDSNYEIIDFGIDNEVFLEKVNAAIAKLCEGQVGYEDLDINGWYNAIIYSIFEAKNVDLNGGIEWFSLAY